MLYDAGKTQIVAFPRGRKGSFTVPHTVSNLYSDTFDNCSIDTLTLSMGQTTYDEYIGNIGASMLVFPEGVTTIGQFVCHWTGQSLMLPTTIT